MSTVEVRCDKSSRVELSIEEIYTVEVYCDELSRDEMFRRFEGHTSLLLGCEKGPCRDHAEDWPGIEFRNPFQDLIPVPGLGQFLSSGMTEPEELE